MPPTFKKKKKKIKKNTFEGVWAWYSPFSDRKFLKDAKNIFWLKLEIVCLQHETRCLVIDSEK